jgi:hypothetical protein
VHISLSPEYFLSDHRTQVLVYLTTSEYLFRPINVGLAVLALPLGALLAIPIQLSMNYGSSLRHNVVVGEGDSYVHKNAGQHPYARALWVGASLLPISSTALTIITKDSSIHVGFPVFFASVNFFAATLVIAECYKLLMDNYDVSDLPLPTSATVSGSSSSTEVENWVQRPSKFHPTPQGITTSHPCLSSAVAISHTAAFVFGAVATAATSIFAGTDVTDVRTVMAGWTGGIYLVSAALVWALWRRREVRLVGAFDETVQKQTGVCLFQDGWGTRWSEVGGLEWWGDEERV